MYYKVVSVIDDKFYSALTYGKIRDFHVNYKIGAWALPIIKNSKLFVFSDLERAERYCRMQFTTKEVEDGIQIFSCEVLNPTTQGRMCEFAGGWAIHKFWEKGGTMYDCSLLLHAVLCDAVKLIERVQYDYAIL